MNLLKIIDDLQLDKIDQEEFLKPAMRRGLFKKATDFSLKAALTSIPFALVAMPKIVKAATSDAVIDALNFALRLEYLEAAFYDQALKASTLMMGVDRAIFEQIAKHENAHVKFLRDNLGAAAVATDRFDFTGGKGGAVTPAPYADVFVNYATFLALSQAFEDTGVRAYKGQAGNVATSNDFLTAALQIHSVEARHAAIVRTLRGKKGYITQNMVDGLPAAIYAGEENTIQGPANISGFTSFGVTADQITQAFDEPLSKDAVLAIAGAFIY